MRVLAAILSVIIAVTIEIGYYKRHRPGCVLCEEERLNEIMITLQESDISGDDM